MRSLKKIILLLVLLKVIALYNAWTEIGAASGTISVPERPAETRPATQPCAGAPAHVASL